MAQKLKSSNEVENSTYWTPPFLVFDSKDLKFNVDIESVILFGRVFNQLRREFTDLLHSTKIPWSQALYYLGTDKLSAYLLR